MVAKMEKEKEQQKNEFNSHVKKASELVERSQNGNKVFVLLGAQGSGKTTVAKHIFKITGAQPATATGRAHGTTVLICEHSAVVGGLVVDTVGKMPDTRGMMHVLACVYNHGWNPVGLVAVHSGHLDKVASYLQASKINVINFEPRTVWKMLERGQDIDTALDLTVDGNSENDPLHVKTIGLPATGKKLEIAGCDISNNLLPTLKRLNFNGLVSGREEEGISNAIAYYLAKSIAERAAFTGTDLEFIDCE